jgi:hypothetical protein
MPAGTHMKPLVLKRLLLCFWAFWFALVTASNVCDGLKALEVLDAAWPFASGNYALIVVATARYGAGAAVNGALFAGVIVWEGTSALLFLRAAIRFGGRDGIGPVRTAFAVSLMLWGAFMIADEIVLTYGFEATHMRVFIAQLASWLAIERIAEEQGPDLG